MMNFNFPIRPAKVDNLPGEQPVKNGLAMTPANMALLTAAGQSVSLSAMENATYYDSQLGVKHCDNMPLEYTRGIDENVLWQASMDAKQKIRKVKKVLEEQKVN